MTLLADVYIGSYAHAESLQHQGLDEPARSAVTLLVLFTAVMLLETAVLSRASRRPSLLSLRDSFIANSLSAAAGAFLLAAGVLTRGGTSVAQFVALFAGTLVLETPVLQALLSPGMSLARTLCASAEMNVASYLLLTFLLYAGLIG